ncbi:hypothetical protein BCR44DRAFT_1514446 [Catenaria anguillulae PL171]|uniref:Uncharacterized protein n=1 Tax=Catenaria anguillulae PL171 TaxID=765915 RepID=A0A1Y2HIP3_9FUNG|nr:hypothetical protein BCR44DRAFT_1514446 [Catenaria anguillulae PL171]
MDKPDAQLLQTLFAENNDLRAKTHVLTRELVSKSIQIENLEDEVHQLRSLKESDKAAKGAMAAAAAAAAKKGGGGLTGGGPGGAAGSGNASKELEDAMYAIDRKNNEIRQLKDEIAQLQTDLEAQELTNDKLEADLSELQNEFAIFRSRANGNASDSSGGGTSNSHGSMRPSGSSMLGDMSHAAKQVTQLREQLTDAEALIARQKQQIQDLTTESVRKYSAQQTQMQGLESLLEQVKQQYEEFIQVTKIENDAIKQAQQIEYEQLKLAFETHKKEQYDEKRTMMLEHHAMLFTMQALFDEYKKTCEVLFSTEAAKLEDELVGQGVRYEHEILYIIQAKDKFYSDMMVSKDAKIMNLIEGSDLTSLLQKHEMEIDAVRKEYTLELERIKSQQESEQKHVISLLQRQNASLESKAEKLGSHIKTLESKIKDLLVAVEAKNKAIADRDAAKLEMEAKHAAAMEQERAKYLQVVQEKEYLRHKGTGKNTVENMLKRISRETVEMGRTYAELEQQYEIVCETRGKLERQVRERDRWIECLEREVKKRTDEFKLLTSTFEGFLAQRAKAARKERQKKALAVDGKADSGVDHVGMDGQESRVASAGTGVVTSGRFATLGASAGTVGNASGSAGLDFTVQPVSKQPVRIRVPDVNSRIRANQIEQVTMEQQELDRASSYLRRFKTMSRAFATGELRRVAKDLAVSTDLLNEDEGEEGRGASYQQQGGMVRIEDLEESTLSSSSSPTRLVPLYSKSPESAIVSQPAHRVYESSSPSSSSPHTSQPAVSQRGPTDPLTASQTTAAVAAAIKAYDYDAQPKVQVEDAAEAAKRSMIGAFKGAKVGAAAGASQVVRVRQKVRVLERPWGIWSLSR